MEEQLILAETFKLAKEKGFIPNKRDNSVSRNSIDIIPTQSLLQDWIETNHKIFICIELYGNSFQHIFIPIIIKNMNPNNTISANGCKTRKEALEKALFESLKLI